MAGRPRSFDRDEAVGRFAQVFWDKGFAQTSVDELQDVTGIQRGSFYAAFTDKDTAFLDALAHYAEHFTGHGLAALHAPDQPRSGLAGYIRFVGEFLSKRPGRGCFLLTTISQPPNLSPNNQEVLDRLIDKLLTPLKQVCQKVEEEEGGETAKTLYAYTLGQVLGMNALARSGEGQSLHSVAAMAADLLEGKSKALP